VACEAEQLGHPATDHHGGGRSVTHSSVVLGYFQDGPSLVTLVMNGWADGEPGWWLILQDQPTAGVELDGRRCTVTGRAAEGEERSDLWARWREIDTTGTPSRRCGRPRRRSWFLEPEPPEPMLRLRRARGLAVVGA